MLAISIATIYYCYSNFSLNIAQFKYPQGLAPILTGLPSLYLMYPVPYAMGSCPGPNPLAIGASLSCYSSKNAVEEWIGQ